MHEQIAAGANPLMPKGEAKVENSFVLCKKLFFLFQ